MLMFVAFVLIPQCLDDVYESISTECLPIRTGAGARRTILRIPLTRGASRSEGFSILTRTLRRLDTSTTWRFSKDVLIQLLSEFCEYPSVELSGHSQETGHPVGHFSSAFSQEN